MGNWCWGWCCGGSEYLWVGCTGVAPDYQNTLRKYALDGEFLEGTGIPNYPDSESMSPQGIDFDSAGDVYTCHTNVGIFNPERGIAKNSRSNLSLGWYNKNHPLTYYDLVVVDNHPIIADAVYGAASGNSSTVQHQIRKFLPIPRESALRNSQNFIEYRRVFPNERSFDFHSMFLFFLSRFSHDIGLFK